MTIKKSLITLLILLLPLGLFGQVQDSEDIVCTLPISEYVVMTVSANTLTWSLSVPPMGTWISSEYIQMGIQAAVGNGAAVHLYSETDGDFVDTVDPGKVIALGTDFSIRGDGDYAGIASPPLTVASQDILTVGGTGTYSGNMFLRYLDTPRVPGTYQLTWTLTAVIE